MNEPQKVFPWMSVGALVIALVWFTYYFVVIHWIVPNTDPTKIADAFARRGQFGDMFGGLTCLLSAFTLLGVYNTWRLQRHEIAE